MVTFKANLSQNFFSCGALLHFILFDEFTQKWTNMLKIEINLNSVKRGREHVYSNLQSKRNTQSKLRVKKLNHFQQKFILPVVPNKQFQRRDLHSSENVRCVES